jgi:hypothetical protein
MRDKEKEPNFHGDITRKEICRNTLIIGKRKILKWALEF